MRRGSNLEPIRLYALRIKRAPDGASASGGIGFVQTGLDGAALGLSLWLDSKIVHNTDANSQSDQSDFSVVAAWKFIKLPRHKISLNVHSNLQVCHLLSIGAVMLVRKSLDLSCHSAVYFFNF